MMMDIEQDGMTIFGLDVTELATIVDISENSTGTAGTQAKGILEFAYGIDYCDCISAAGESGYKSSGVFNPKSFEKMYIVDIAVEPNPAKDWAAFNFTLPDVDSEGVIKISDVSGKIVATIPIAGAEGQKIWDTSKIKPGVYFYTLNISGFNKSGKIVVNK